MGVPGSVEYLPSAGSANPGPVNGIGHGLAELQNCLYCSGEIVRREGITSLGSRWGRSASVYAINDADDVAGSVENFAHDGTAAIWRAAAQWKPELLGPRAQAGTGISEAGVVIGMGADGPFVWRAGHYVVLNDALVPSGWTLTSVVAISRSGVILARGQHPSLGAGILLVRLP
jgi:hypothetical protein